MFEKLANAIIKHPKPILALWIVLLIVALPFAAGYNSVLNYDMTTMEGAESESVTGSEIISENFYASTAQGTIIAVPYDTPEELATAQRLLDPTSGLQTHLDEKYGAGKVTAASMGMYSKDQTNAEQSGVYLIAISYNDEELTGTDEIGNIRDVVAATKADLAIAPETYVTGNDAITYDTMVGAAEDVAKIDPISILLILLLIGLFFLTVVTAVVPPATVGMAYGIVLALIFFLGGIFDIFYITSIIVLVSMLGAGCDYSIFIISRYREERKNGKDKDAALKEAIKWAGESVATSGLAVIIGFGVMSFCSFSMVSTMGIILALGIVVAMIAALTFIPALISVVGDKIFWPSKISTYQAGSKARNGFYGRCVNFSKRYFRKAGQRAIKYAVPIVVAALLVSVPLCYVAFTSDESYDMISIMPDSEGKHGVEIITERAEGGLIMPTYVLYELNSPIAVVDNTTHTLTWTPEGYAYLQTLNKMAAEIAAADENISYALGPTPWASVYELVYQGIIAQGVPATMITPEMVNQTAVNQLPAAVQPAVTQLFETIGWNAPATAAAPYIDYAVNYGAGLVATNGNYAVLIVMMADEPMSAVSMDSIKALKELAAGYAAEYHNEIKDTWVTGTAVTVQDISEVVDKEFTWIEIGVVVLIFILLFFVLGSYFTPIRSLFTILLSISWTIGLTHLVFTELLGIPVTWIVPIVLLVVCLGLGMDYDILLTTRIKEGKSKGLSNDEAITNALEKSGAVITLCGLIMGGTFLTLLSSSSPMLQEFGFALGFAILIDSLIVVTYLVPALMHLMGDWSWKGPKFLQKRRATAKE